MCFIMLRKFKFLLKLQSWYDKRMLILALLFFIYQRLGLLLLCIKFLCLFSWVILTYNFSFLHYYSCQVEYQDNTGLIKHVWKYSFILYSLESSCKTRMIDFTCLVELICKTHWVWCLCCGKILNYYSISLLFYFLNIFY